MRPPAEAKTKQFANVGLALGLFRQIRGLTQATLATRASVGKGQLSKYESGRELPKLASLERLLEVLEIRQDAFFGVVALLDGLHGQISAGTALTLLTTIPSTRSLPSLDEAFARIFETLFFLQRSVLHLLFTGTALPSPQTSGLLHPDA
jgi:transcriptional regulator with XRE-family HTH domain